MNLSNSSKKKVPQTISSFFATSIKGDSSFLKFLLAKYENFSNISPLKENILKNKSVQFASAFEMLINRSDSLIDFVGTCSVSSLVCASVSYEEKDSVLFSSLTIFDLNTSVNSLYFYFDFLSEKSNLTFLYLFAGKKELLETFCSFLFRVGLDKLQIKFLTLTKNPSIFQEVLVSRKGEVFYNYSNTHHDLLFIKLNLIEESQIQSYQLLNKSIDIVLNFI